MQDSEVINKAIDYIRHNLERKISIDDVASYCGYSKFYFSREFKKQTGESIHAFIKRLRLEQIAFKLRTEQHRTISDICIDFGIDPANFTAAFSKEKNISPYYYRKCVDSEAVGHRYFHSEKNQLETFDECRKKITVEKLPDCKVVYQRFIGPYEDMAKNWCAFTEKYRNIITGESVFFDRTFDDPVLGDESRCMYDLAVSVPDDCMLENTCTLDGGKFAVYHFNGQRKEIFAAYQNLFSVWFPKSGMIVDQRYGFNRYRKVDGVSVEVDLCIPVV